MAVPLSRQCFIRLRSRKDQTWFAPPELRARLVADAEADESNMTEVARQILAKRFRIPVMPSARRATAATVGEELNLRLPIDLYQAVAHAAADSGRTVNREILATLCHHYGIRFTLPPKRTRQRKAAAA